MDGLFLALAKNALIHAPDLILLLVTAILIPFFVKWARAKLSREHLDMLSFAADIAYDVVDSVARKTPSKVDDKAALALKVVRDQLKVKLSEADEARIKALLNAKHEASKRK